MNEYTTLAYKRSMIEALQRHILDRYVQSDSPPKDVLICEEVPRGESMVPPEQWMLMLEQLQKWENHVRAEMLNFTMAKTDHLPEMIKEETTDVERPKRKYTRRKKERKVRKPRKPSDGNSG